MSSFIKLSDLSFSFDNQTADLISGLNASFYAGWTSLCGVNGSGKTTLLKLIQGELSPDAGHVQTSGVTASIPQSTEFPPDGLSDIFRSRVRGFARMREQLGLKEDWITRWESLSIGERKRVQIAAALAADPDILLVDEPTNHVDAQTRVVVLEALRSFSGVGIVISHDRLLLNELCDHTAFIDAGTLEVFNAPYDTAKAERDSHISGQKRDREHLKSSLKKTERDSQSQGERIAKRAGSLSKRGLDKHDHDTRERINRAKLFNADQSDSRKKRSLGQKADRLTQQIDQIAVKKQYELGVFFTNIPQPKPLQLKACDIENSGLRIKAPEIVLSPGDRLAITGANGAGKSTLLRHWLQNFPYPYIYGPQEFTKEETEQLAKNLAQTDREERGKIMTLVSCLGSDPRSLAEGSAPSPGVWQKLVIARAIISATPFLILDEPTNHMDLAAIEVLEDALATFKGTQIFVSHDDAFVSIIGTRRLCLTRTNDNSLAQEVSVT